MALKLITPATELAVSLPDIKKHLRIDSTDEDDLITAYIFAATEVAEQTAGRLAVMPQTWELTLDAFPGAFEISRIPALSITSIKYFDDAGIQRTLGTDRYVLDNTDDFGPAYVVPGYGTTWPATQAQINAVSVRYVAGYPNAASVPYGIKAWIKLQVGAMFENREAEIAGPSVQSYALGFADRLLDRYRDWSL